MPITDNMETREMSGLRYLVCAMIRMQAYTWRRKVLSGSVVLRDQIMQSKTRKQDCRLCCSRFYRAMHFSAKRGIAIACRLSVRPSVCNVGELWSHMLEFFENNFAIS